MSNEIDYTSIYEENDFDTQEDYLEHLSQDYDSDVVDALSSILGPNEDYDGLVNSLEDMEIL